MYRRPLSSTCADESDRSAGGHKTLGRQAHGAHGASSQAHHSVIGAPGEGCCAASDAYSLADSAASLSGATGGSLSSATGQSLSERLSASSAATLLSCSSGVSSELGGGDGDASGCGSGSRSQDRSHGAIAMRDKYTLEHFELIKVLGKGSFGKVCPRTCTHFHPHPRPRPRPRARPRTCLVRSETFEISTTIQVLPRVSCVLSIERHEVQRAKCRCRANDDQMRCR